MYKRSFRSYVKKVVYFIPVAAITAGIILLRHRLTHILVPVLLAAVMSVILSPAVSYLTGKRKLKKSTAATVSLVLLIFTLFLVLYCLFSPLMNSLKQTVNNSQDIALQIENTFNGINIKMQELLRIEKDSDLALWMNDATSHIYTKLFTSLSNAAGGLLDKAAGASMEILAILVDGVTALVLTFYFLRDGKMLKQWLLELFPFSIRETLKEIFSGVGKIFSDFLKGQFLVSLVLGAAQTIGLVLLKIPYAPLLGFLAGLLNVIPYFGPFIGAVPAVLAALFISPWKALWVVALFVILQQVDNILLTPKIVEGQLGIHPVTTIIAVFLGGEFFGLWGVLFSVPVYAALRYVVRKALPV